MATASGRHSSLGLIHTSVGDALLSGESFKYLHVSEVFVEQPKYGSQSSNGTSDQKSLTTRVDFIVPAQLPSECHVGKKKKKKRTAEVDAGNARAPWNKNWISPPLPKKKAKKKERGGVRRQLHTTSVSLFGSVKVTIPVLTVRSERRSNGSDHTSR